MEYDGLSPVSIPLDHESTVRYWPTIGLPDSTYSAIADVLAASEKSQDPPPEDSTLCSGSGRRQWCIAGFDDRPLGEWQGPRRWQRASWRLDQTEAVLAIRAAVEGAIQTDADASQRGPRLIESFNTVLINRYLSGADSIKWHCDDESFYYVEPSTGNGDIVIASVSLGAERWFSLRTHPQRVAEKEQRKAVRIKLRSGSLLVMAGATQRNWQHSLPKDESIGEVTRINLTFRRVVPPQTQSYLV
jgi:alkylated DNA repair dioxygenase AlkB